MANVTGSEEQLVLDSAQLELEVKKKRLLEELESALVPKDAADKVVTAQPNPIRPSLGIEVIDETALLHSVVKNGASKQSISRRRGGGSKNTTTTTTTTTITTTKKPEESNSKSKSVKKYSRKEMEALRFVKLAQQRKLWKAIHASLQSAVANEYETLLFTPQNPLPRSKPILTGAANCENMDGKNVSSEDPSCTHSLMGEELSTVEECSEDDDSEEDCASILRPAFFVAGEPNFDAGPPEDGWEYLRRVRWEADQIPKVKVAKLDRSKLNKEQSAYMPKIPDIAKCPDHLLPLKQWEDVFLAEFSALRTNFSCLDGSSAICSSNLHVQSRISQLVGNDFGEFSGVMNRDVLLCNHLSIGKANDESTNLTAEGKETSIDQTSSSSPSPPLLSVILAIDSVARVSMLLKRIRLLEPANTLTKNDCMWLFALCATVDAPLDADTCAALRSLLRKCASIRAGKAELDDEVVMLNILATISGRYFGQSEN
ncbi:uncharacterized protein LOC113872912 [Abrus precatorius]|uniref:Uncharacterized protein LOC113872912 n=1 Tax=Abrus precatorius TaxID=3816 RepID=A0A8B8MHA8_ABRPR|nr:uncharacterized protein LOC113872912 [Abrus precatorius]